jgi:hypothetical protein
MSDDPCGETNGTRVDEGWIPIFNDTGDLNIWLHARGC